MRERTELENRHVWDLTSLYANEKTWEQEFLVAEGEISKISSFKDQLSKSAATLAEAFTCYFSTLRKLEKLYAFAHLKSDEDTSNTFDLARQDQILNLFTRFSALSSFISPELISIDPDLLEKFYEEKILATYRRNIREIVRYKPHTLSKKEEEIIALGSEVFSSFQKIFSQLNNADLEFGTLTVDGKVETLSHGSYSLFLKNKKRELREKAFLQYYKVYENHKNMLSANYTSSIKKNSYLAKVKNHSSALEKALFSDNVSTDVYQNLIKTVSENLAPLQHYYELRKKALKLNEQRIFDSYVSLVDSCEVKNTYEEAVKLVVASLSPLGGEYCEILNKGLTTERWVDVFETKGKRSGAYSSGCYDSFPYILLNYQEEDLHSVYTLTHEAGHSMHSYYSRKNQSFQDHDYTIFVAEVASTFNEQLLSKFLNEKYVDDKKMRFYLINQQIDDIKSTLFRQTMFAEFEMLVHQAAEENKSLTLDLYRKIYADLLRKYFGKSVEIDELDSLECFRIPHFYSAFYVYKYATGLSAAIALAEQVVSGGETDRQRYLNFLKSGGSKHPLELLKDAGVDMASPLPIEKAVGVFGKLVCELEKLL